MENADVALTVADLCANYDSENHQIDDSDDSSTIGNSTIDQSTTDNSTIDNSTLGFDEDDDSFIANSSLCKEHRSAIHMLNSLRREVVEMVRSDDGGTAPKKSPRNVTIDLGRQKQLLTSPLLSPLLSRTTVPASNKYPIPSLNDYKITPDGSECDPHHLQTSDDNTFCSMDDSIQNELKVLKAGSKDLERELEAENLDSVLEAIERIRTKSDEQVPKAKGLVSSEDEITSRERIRTEPTSGETSFEYSNTDSQLFDGVILLRTIQNYLYSMNIKILIACIVIGLIREYVNYCINRWKDSRQW